MPRFFLNFSRFAVGFSSTPAKCLLCALEIALELLDKHDALVDMYPWDLPPVLGSSPFGNEFIHTMEPNTNPIRLFLNLKPRSLSR
ncbi:hypothetical protein SLA2020_136590 [Shorea laevis]